MSWVTADPTTRARDERHLRRVRLRARLADGASGIFEGFPATSGRSRRHPRPACLYLSISRRARSTICPKPSALSKSHRNLQQQRGASPIPKSRHMHANGSQGVAVHVIAHRRRELLERGRRDLGQQGLKHTSYARLAAAVVAPEASFRDDGEPWQEFLL